jgi:flavin reductase (DIM6/NTAB) family NADH-FMN oxidoreductase RutF
MTAVDLDLRRAFARYPTGVAALAGFVDGRPTGLVANSFTSVSLDPALASVCIAHSSTTWPILRSSARLAVNILAADQQEVSRQLSARVPDRFAGIAWRATDGGGVLIEGAAAWFECSIAQELPVGDHDIVVLRVHDLGASATAAPLIFHGSSYRRLG